MSGIYVVCDRIKNHPVLAYVGDCLAGEFPEHDTYEVPVVGPAEILEVTGASLTKFDTESEDES